jgi:hypothetical protein
MLLRPVVLALALVAALFEFHSPFWLDLHHRLYAESARVQIEHRMPPEAQKRWQPAVAAYRELYPERSLKTLFENDAAQATRRALDATSSRSSIRSYAAFSKR